MSINNSGEYAARLGSIRVLMEREGVDGLLLTQNVDIYYMCGSMQGGYLFVPRAGDPVFYVRRSVARAVEESAVQVRGLGPFRDFGRTLAADFPAVFGADGQARPTIALPGDVTPAQAALRLQGLVPNALWVEGSPLIRRTRMIKSPYEIGKIRAAAQVTDAALRRALTYVREGMSELELVARLEFDMRMNGHLGIMRMRAFNQEIITGVVGAGEAVARPTYFDGPGGGSGLSAASPQGSSHRPIKRNEPILVDIGCCIDGYVIDQTRTLVIGELPDELLRAYNSAERILRMTEQRLRPGVVCQELYAAALEQAGHDGLAHHFMGYGDDQVKFLGHGVGLEVDEWPVLAKGFADPLEQGMVIAIEPKYTFPGIGMVGIENTYAITADGFERLTLSPEGVLHI